MTLSKSKKRTRGGKSKETLALIASASKHVVHDTDDDEDDVDEREILEKEKQLDSIQLSLDKITRQQSHSVISPVEAANQQKELLNEFR